MNNPGYPCQEELARLGRLAITGEMVAGLVHELSQPLGSALLWIEGCASRLRSDGAAGAELLASLELTARQVRWATEMVCRLKDFLRKGPPRRSEVEISTLVASAVAMAEPEARRKEIAIRVLPDGQETTVVADGIQIEQVILNLLMNAMEAIDGSGADRREVVVRMADVGDDAVEVAVSDTGPGLSAGARKRLFEPFFTTKPGGMGLGLSISRSIVEAHGGRLSARPNPEGGTVFQFTLPTNRRGDHPVGPS